MGNKDFLLLFIVIVVVVIVLFAFTIKYSFVFLLFVDLEKMRSSDDDDNGDVVNNEQAAKALNPAEESTLHHTDMFVEDDIICNRKVHDDGLQINPLDYAVRLKESFAPSHVLASCVSKPMVIQVNFVEANFVPAYVNGIQWELLKSEWQRLITYTKYPQEMSVSTIKLAAKGFAFLGNSDVTGCQLICCFCATVIKAVTDFDKVDQVHKEMRKDCPIVKGISCNNESIMSGYPKNVDALISQYFALKQPKQQHSMTTAKPLQEVTINSQQLPEPKSYQPTNSSASYVFVTNTTDISNEIDPPENLQVSNSVDQPSVQGPTLSMPQNIVHNSVEIDGNTTLSENNGRSNSNAQQNSDGNASSFSNQNDESQPSVESSTNEDSSQPYEKLGIITARPKRFEYSLYETRLSSFTNGGTKWPEKHHMKPSELASAGYFFTGYSDCARCFYCGGGLRNWEIDDDVWVEHARWFIKCAFLMLHKGKDFINAVHDLNKVQEKISYSDVIQQIRTTKGNVPCGHSEKVNERDPAIRAVIDNGYEKEQVLELAIQMSDNGEVLSSDKLFKMAQVKKLKLKESLNRLGSDSVSVKRGGNLERDQEAIRTLRIENNELRQQVICKICMDREVSIAFLPCGHYVSCPQCCCALKSCPVCRVVIKGMVRAYMG